MNYESPNSRAEMVSKTLDPQIIATVADVMLSLSQSGADAFLAKLMEFTINSANDLKTKRSTATDKPHSLDPRDPASVYFAGLIRFHQCELFTAQSLNPMSCKILLHIIGDDYLKPEAKAIIKLRGFETYPGLLEPT